VRREDLPRHPTSTFVLPRWQAMYVAVNKAACTSLKWLIADLQDERRERFYESLSSEISRTMTIHRRRLWEHTPMAADLDDDELTAISPDGGWFVFAVVRHPTSRLFSAWQSKLLLREPSWVAKCGGADWFPRIPRCGDDIVEDFARFVRAVDRDPALVMANRHFAPQHRLLALKRMRYTRIYTTHEIPLLLEDLSGHLRERGWQGAELALERSNAAPLRPIAGLFGEDVLQAARSIYRQDFAAFEFGGPAPAQLEPVDTYPDAAVAEIGRLIERSERIGDLSLRARELRELARAMPQPRSRARKVLSHAKHRLSSLLPPHAAGGAHAQPARRTV
jgi:hypothetical protein